MADVLDVIFLLSKDVKPGRVLGQRLLQLPGSQVDAGHRDRLRRVPDEDVSAEAVVHEVPKEVGIEKVAKLSDRQTLKNKELSST